MIGNQGGKELAILRLTAGFMGIGEGNCLVGLFKGLNKAKKWVKINLCKVMDMKLGKGIFWDEVRRGGDVHFLH